MAKNNKKIGKHAMIISEGNTIYKRERDRENTKLTFL